MLPPFVDLCETCDCVSTYTQKSGVYAVMIAGDLKNVYCSFEGNLVWTVRNLDNISSSIFYVEYKYTVKLCNWKYIIILRNVLIEYSIEKAIKLSFYELS